MPHRSLFVASALVLAACGELFHDTDWDTRCGPTDCVPDASAEGGGGPGGVGGSVSSSSTSTAGGAGGEGGGGQGGGGNAVCFHCNQALHAPGTAPLCPGGPPDLHLALVLCGCEPKMGVPPPCAVPCERSLCDTLPMMTDCHDCLAEHCMPELVACENDLD